jgi:hypothetical protein
MSNADYDDPETDAEWCAERRRDVARYLEVERVAHGQIGAQPAWHVAPYVSVWAIESHDVPGTLGWWAVSGDIPNDYVSASKASSPRDAVRVIASLWHEAAQYMLRGEKHPTFRIGSSDREQELAPMLESRAVLLLDWVDDPEAWEETDA